MTPAILYEDEEVLVIDKPAGLLVHPDGKSTEPTLIDWIQKQYPSIKEVGEPAALPDGTLIARPGIVHRLDRETSGVMVIAKTPESFLHLKRQFQEREVHKRYHAFVWGEFKDGRGLIDRPIGRSPNGNRWSATRGARGTMREAVTWYKALSHKNGFTFVEAQPRTGRTHQIRVHFLAVNHPVVGDKLYAPGRPPALGFTRTALHARSIAFKVRGGNEVSVTAPYPADFLRAFTELGIEPELASR